MSAPLETPEAMAERLLAALLFTRPHPEAADLVIAIRADREAIKAMIEADAEEHERARLTADMGDDRYASALHDAQATAIRCVAAKLGGAP